MTSESGVDVLDVNARRIGGVAAPKRIADLTVSADVGHAVIVDANDHVTIWSLVTGERIAAWTAPGAGRAKLVVGPGARRVAFASSDFAGIETLTVRAGNSGDALVTQFGGGTTFQSLALTADGRHLVTHGSSGLRVYALP